MLAEARKSAAEAGVDIHWIQMDAKEMHFEEGFDAAICLCEGAFGLIGTAEDILTHELSILKAIHRSLQPGAKLILNAPNGLSKIRSATTDQVQSGAFDPLTLTETFEVEIEAPDGPKRLAVHERGFVPSELRIMLDITGFRVDSIFGGTAGAWNRETVSLDEIEIMAIAIRE